MAAFAAAAAAANNDLGSVDSSDTYASCNTHPFLSQGDLTSDVADPGCALVDLMLTDSNLYVNPLDAPRSPAVGLQPPQAEMKRSASGDRGMRSLGASPMEEGFKGFGGTGERGSRGSLNEAPVPKHRKTRFQQGVKPRPRFGESQESLERRAAAAGARKGGGGGGSSTFMGGRSLASATRLINQHLFGHHSLGGARSGKNSGSKSSLSVDSIDSRTSPTPDAHRRSKSILKKSEASSGHARSAQQRDPETEQLISDGGGGAGGGDAGSGSDCSPRHRPGAPSPPASPAPAQRHAAAGTLPLRAIGPKATPKPHALPIKFVGLGRQGEGGAARRIKSPLMLLEDLLGGEKHSRDEATVENKHKERLEAAAAAVAAGGGGGCAATGMGAPGDGGCRGDQQMFICPPGGAEEASPTEQTKLLHQAAAAALSIEAPSHQAQAQAQSQAQAQAPTQRILHHHHHHLHHHHHPHEPPKS